MPMHLHHGKTCADGQVADDYKDVVLPSVAFAWAWKRAHLLAALELEPNTSFTAFRTWCMQPLPTDHFLGRLSRVHLAFEVAAEVEQLVAL